MVSVFLPPNAEKVRDQFESMMTVLKRTIPKWIPKWERSCQGDGGHHGDDDDDENPLIHQQEDMDILNDDDGGGDDDDVKPGFSVLVGRSQFAKTNKTD